MANDGRRNPEMMSRKDAKTRREREVRTQTPAAFSAFATLRESELIISKAREGDTV